MSSYHVYNGELVGVGNEERPALFHCLPDPHHRHCQWRHGDIIPQIGIPPPSPAQAGILICHK